MRDKGEEPSQPEQAETGPGSREGYVCYGYRRVRRGKSWDGTAVDCFIPNVLEQGRKTPVVLFFHGYMIISPWVYMDFVEHLVYQGYVVVFPRINIGNPRRALFELDQGRMMERLLRNVETGLELVSCATDASRLYLFGHSLGALMAACYPDHTGERVRARLIANPVCGQPPGMPAPVSKVVRIKQVDWRRMAGEAGCPAVVLTGDQDDMTGEAQARELFEAIGSDRKGLYRLQGDSHGDPPLRADHNAPMCRMVNGPSFVMDRLGGAVRVDAADYRFYWAAMDTIMGGEARMDFDMGCWSDGRALKPVQRLDW